MNFSALTYSLLWIVLGYMCLCVQGRKLAKIDSTHYVDVEEANDYVDRIIAEYQDIEKEPHDLPPKTSGFGHVIFGVNVTGEITAYDGHVSGLTTVERAGNSQVTKEDGRTRVSTTLRMGVVDLVSKAKVAFMKKGPTVDIQGKIALAIIKVELVINDDKSAELTDLKLVEMKGVELKITSALGPLGFLASAVVKVLKGIFKGLFQRVVEKYMREILSDVIKETTAQLA